MNDSLCAVFFHLFYDVSENNLSVSKYSNARRLNKSFFFSKEKKKFLETPFPGPSILLLQLDKMLSGPAARLSAQNFSLPDTPLPRLCRE